MNKLIIANWKMNPLTPHDAKVLYEVEYKGAVGVQGVTTVLCSPTCYLAMLAEEDPPSEQHHVMRGAQNMFWEEEGAYTGETSPVMLTACGVRYVIIGHSERRNYLKETDETIQKKINAALQHNLIPIFCVGETATEKAQGETHAVLERQIRDGLSGIEEIADSETQRRIVVAYEPRWAIGTGTPETAEDTVQVIRFLKTLVSEYSAFSFTFIYGGSLNDENARMYLGESEIEGALVGGASLDAEKFERIIRIASEV
ncbi:MAG: triose-phosphate isomerase [Patescibacteria group bacterium]|nr:triose-phosphate isomerase [Patescibacteria group bacterium]MDE2437835.1 triose-phosphate isomerase [Patescibacteria group bacterium]